VLGELLDKTSVSENPKMMALGLRKCAVPEPRTAGGINPLHQEKYAEIAAMPLSVSTDFSETGETGQNALHRASSQRGETTLIFFAPKP
jgi:hypothetical protein